MVRERSLRTNEVQNAVFQNFGDTQLSVRTIGNGATMIFTREDVKPKRKLPTIEEAYGMFPDMTPFEREEDDEERI